MKNLDKLTTLDEIRAALVAIRSAHAALNACYSESVLHGGNTPRETVAALVEKIGYAAACETVAEAVNAVGEWDERISRSSRAWAESVENAASREELERCHIYSGSIHSAHVDQIAAAMAAYAPTEAETETTESTESTEADGGKKTTTAAEILAAVRQRLENRKPRSAWDKGVALYAAEFLGSIDYSLRHGCIDVDDLASAAILRKAMLDGASSWSEYSYGGCSLIYNGDIAERLCTPSELRRNRGGERRPNSREEWLDVQARALRQAGNLLYCVVREALRG